MSSEPAKDDSREQGAPSPPSDAPQVSDSAKIDSSSFHPTSIIYITPHNSLTKTIKIYAIPHTFSPIESLDNVLTSSAKAGEKLKDEPPAYTILQGGLFRKAKVYAGAYVSDAESKDTLIAEWNPSRIMHGTNTFTFTPSGEASRRHPLALKRTTVISSRSEAFVKDSVEYVWGFDAVTNDSWMRLVSRVGGREEVCARGYRPFRMENTGGVVVWDGDRVDEVSVVLTAVGMWRKLRQRTKR